MTSGRPVRRAFDGKQNTPVVFENVRMWEIDVVGSAHPPIKINSRHKGRAQVKAVGIEARPGRTFVGKSNEQMAVV